MERGRNEVAREDALLQPSRLPRSSLHAPARVPAEAQDALAEGRAPSAESIVPDPDLHWDERPIALVDRGRLRAVSAGAARQRVRAGMSVAEAKAACAALELLPWEEDVVAAAVLRATAAFVVASPQVTPVAGAPGTWWVGASGFERVGGERGLARALLRVARRWHPGARVALASSCVAARAAVWEGRAAVRDGARGARAADAGVEGAVIVPAGRCASYLAAAPLGLIPMDEELRLALGALGLRTAGALAALGAEDVERRWGAEGLLAWRLAHGEDPRRPVLTRVEAAREVRTELASPAATTEPVLFLVRAALDRLCTTLAADGRAAAAVALTLTLDDSRGAIPSGVRLGAPAPDQAGGGVPRPSVAAEAPVTGPLPAHTVTREIRPPVPVARVAPLFERCRALLDRWPLPAPVCAVAVAVTATAPATGEQGSLLDTAWRDPAALDAALERLRAELGPNVVVRPAVRDAHRPEAAGAWLEVADGASLQPPPAMAAPAPPVADDTLSLPAALRLLERPEPAEVECDAAERPRALHWRGRPVRVARAAGPERLSGEWWTTASYRRDYWRCAGDDGRELLLFQDHAPALEAGHRWFVHGWYD